MAEEKRHAGNWDIRVTLLGTGGPIPVIERFGPSTLIEAGGEILLFDAGRGVLQRLRQLDAPLKELRSLFLTHLHSDHLVGLPDLWLVGWLLGRPEVPLRVWGPRGTKTMMAHLRQAFEVDIDSHLAGGSPPQGIAALAADIAEGVVYENNGLKVTAFKVEHPPIQDAFGYRIDFAERAVVLSGDTRFSEHLIQYAQGVDVIVHEVMAADQVRARLNNLERFERFIAPHTPAEQAGEIFARSQPRLAVYTHIYPTTATAQELFPPTRKTYSGPLEAGEDLMVIEIGDKVTVRRRGEQTA